ncbi:hypothetical protein NJ7G_3399 [Natrinema sp. J7-2]|nr:hypothetical protein NJ7G_3399 [Natrinema sp. J7-2]
MPPRSVAHTESETPSIRADPMWFDLDPQIGSGNTLFIGGGTVRYDFA